MNRAEWYYVAYTHRSSTRGRDGDFGPFGEAGLPVPDGVVLLVVGPARVSRLPAQRHLELRGRARHVVGGVRLCALDHQLRVRHYRCHLNNSRCVLSTQWNDNVNFNNNFVLCVSVNHGSD